MAPSAAASYWIGMGMKVWIPKGRLNAGWGDCRLLRPSLQVAAVCTNYIAIPAVISQPLRVWTWGSMCAGMEVSPCCRHRCTPRSEYAWDVDNHIADLPLADLPATWVEFISCGAPGGGGETEIVWTPALDGTRLVTDGRETFMRDVVWNATHRLQQEFGRICPRRNCSRLQCGIMSPSLICRSRAEDWIN